MRDPATTMLEAVPDRRRGNDLLGVASDGARPLAGRRVLVAEDNVILSMHVAHALEDAGAEVLGPYPFAEEALHALSSERPDAAILDHELMGGTADRVAHRLAEMSVPFVYFTGTEDAGLRGGGAPVVAKPADAGALLGAVTALLSPTG